LGLVAGYLLYIAYGLFQGREETDTSMTPAARYLFIALFTLSAIALLVYAFFVWKNRGKKKEDEASRDDKDSMK
ncbi:MAG: hypothetical protein IKR59_00080, partial [Lachnospiraceae bacterium]|nr:hypothetical protein [Lachnospiraceae bacterium]